MRQVAQTRKSTAWFGIAFLVWMLCYGSRTQAVIALSSSAAELFTINAGSTEALHIQRLLKSTGLLTEQQREQSDTYGLERQKHCNKDWNIQEKQRAFSWSIVSAIGSFNFIQVSSRCTQDIPTHIFAKSATAQTLHVTRVQVGLRVQHGPSSSFTMQKLRRRVQTHRAQVLRRNALTCSNATLLYSSCAWHCDFFPTKLASGERHVHSCLQ